MAVIDSGSITDVDGIEVGHAHDLDHLTGCTVVLCHSGATVGVDVRGLAPGTRETDLCRPGTLVERAHAILLAGGSAFGLNAAAGVMRYLWERDIGFDTGITKVPIVPGAVIYDLGIGGIAWPDEDAGYEACVRATNGRVVEGCVGAGTGATVGKMLGPGQATKSGLGTASAHLGPYTVGAIAVVNAVGNVIRPGTDEIIAGARDPTSGRFIDPLTLGYPEGDSRHAGFNTTLAVIATDAELPAESTHYLSVLAHDALGRTIRPVHTLLDGDTVFTLATGRTAGNPHLVYLGAAIVSVLERAIVRAAQMATPAGGLPAASSMAESPSA